MGSLRKLGDIVHIHLTCKFVSIMYNMRFTKSNENIDCWIWCAEDFPHLPRKRRSRIYCWESWHPYDWLAWRITPVPCRKPYHQPLPPRLMASVRILPPETCKTPTQTLHNQCRIDASYSTDVSVYFASFLSSNKHLYPKGSTERLFLHIPEPTC